MHRKILEAATEKQAKDFLDETILMIRETNYDLYEKLEEHLYYEVFGCHFTDWLLEEAVSKMVNEDGSKGAHWTVEQTTQVAERNGISFTKFNKYDFNYVMNMMFSDFYGAVSDDITTYFNLAMRFLEDKDAKDGKSLKYYFKIVK